MNCFGRRLFRLGFPIEKRKKKIVSYLYLDVILSITPGSIFVLNNREEMENSSKPGKGQEKGPGVN